MYVHVHIHLQLCHHSLVSYMHISIRWSVAWPVISWISKWQGPSFKRSSKERIILVKPTTKLRHSHPLTTWFDTFYFLPLFLLFLLQFLLLFFISLLCLVLFFPPSSFLFLWIPFICRCVTFRWGQTTTLIPYFSCFWRSYLCTPSFYSYVLFSSYLTVFKREVHSKK